MCNISNFDEGIGRGITKKGSMKEFTSELSRVLILV
jgi:hypothetical protein